MVNKWQTKAQIEHNNQELYKRMQNDINALLSSVGNVFDDMAEYYDADRDPINHLDIDGILKNGQKISYEIGMIRQNFPKHPKKIVKAMPKEVQELMQSVSFERKSK